MNRTSSSLSWVPHNPDAELVRSVRGSAELGYREQNTGVFKRLECVTGVWDDEEISGYSFNGGVAGGEAYPADKYLHGRFPGVLVLVESLSGGERDERLAQCPCVPPEHGVGATSAWRGPGHVEVLIEKYGQRGSFHCSLH